jgi:hypothetical protein
MPAGARLFDIARLEVPDGRLPDWRPIIGRTPDKAAQLGG